MALMRLLSINSWIFLTREFARYAPVESSAAMDEVYKETSDAIGKMENILKSKN